MSNSNPDRDWVKAYFKTQPITMEGPEPIKEQLIDVIMAILVVAVIFSLFFLGAIVTW